MTNEEIRIAIAKSMGLPRLWSTALPTKTVHCNIPKYHEDANASLQLIDRMAEEGWRTDLNQGLNKSWECIFFRKANENTKPENRGERGEFDPPDTEEHYGAADTFPLAVAGAYLKARNLWPEEGA